MNRNQSPTLSGFGKEVILRIRQKEADQLHRHMRQVSQCEQIAFGLGVHERTANGTVFILNELLLPDSSELSNQSACSISPALEFMNYLYFRASSTKQDIMEFHTHPGSQSPIFSSIDEHHASLNAEYITERLPEPVTLLMVVGNNRFESFDSVVWERSLHQFRSVERIEVLGRPSEIYPLGESQDNCAIRDNETYDRQSRIPGWNQTGLARQRIGIVGAGGDGAPILQALVGMGAGTDGFLVLVDHDLVELSNLPRIPYANPEHAGMPKVRVATQWAGRKNPSIPLFPYPCSITEKTVQDKLKECTVLFGCVDNDGGRMVLNNLAVRYGIPLIDLGCDIQVEEEKVFAGGQVRVVLPGQNACQVCCRGFDPSEAAVDLMDDTELARRAARGYVRNSSADATPSVANLNAITAQFAIAQFLGLVNGEQFAAWDYVHFDQFTLNTMVASTKQREDCPCCGNEGYLGKGYSKENQKVKPKLALTHVEKAS